MSAAEQKPDFNQFQDDELVLSVQAEVASSSTFAAALDDAAAVKDLLDELIRLRKRGNLTQSEVARVMGVRQPTVSQFETESSDPRLTTLQRYARAVGGRVCWQVIGPSGVFAPQQRYVESEKSGGIQPRGFRVTQRSLPSKWSASNSRLRLGFDYAA